MSPSLPEQGGYGGGEDRREGPRTENQGGVAALTPFPSTPGEEAAGGDRLIHEQDLAWLQQADGEWPSPLSANSSEVLDPLDKPGLHTESSLLTMPRLCHLSLTSQIVSLKSRPSSSGCGRSDPAILGCGL